MEEGKFLEIGICSSYFLDTNSKVQMKIESFRFYSNNTIHILGNDKNGTFEIKGNMNMNKFILEKRYTSSNSVVFMAGLFFTNVIKFICDSIKKYEDMFPKLNENFFHGEIKTDLVTFTCPNITLYLNRQEIENGNSNMNGLMQKNFKINFVELNRISEDMEFNINIYNFDDVEQRKIKFSDKEFVFLD